MQLTGIYRAELFSPNQHASNDARILEQTAAELATMGCRVGFTTEEEVERGTAHIRSDMVFSMAQGPRANDALAPLHRDGRLIVNSPDAVRHCYRQNLYRLLEANCELVPPTELVLTRAPGELRRLFLGGGQVWVKRGDVHSTGEGDVVKVSDPDQCGEVLARMAGRGIRLAALQRHLPGQVVKFYGVVGTPFFRYYAEADRKVSPVGFSRFRPTVERLVRRLGLEVYGGDAVMAEDGTVRVIDVNDWPSFAPFRDEAASAIARRIFQLAAGHQAARAVPAAAQAHGTRSRAR